jgi:P-type Ca2+ transporter type 2C
MARAAERPVHRATDDGEWWSSSTEEIGDQLDVDPSVGLSSKGAAKVLARDGPNALPVVNAVVGLRQEGKAESAMNALKAVVKTTARVRRDGSEAQIAGEELGVNDAPSIKAASPSLRSPYAGRSANRFPDLDRQQCLPHGWVV